MKYDAFISYRHIPRDIAIAEQLHKLLEHYRVPRHVQKMTGKKKIQRVFRDRDELPLADNLNDNILTALDQSEYLLVICSPESKESLWVQREVKYFLEHHDRSHVLAVLTAGEPEDAFPELILWEDKEVISADGSLTIVREEVEPLAADVRADSTKDSLKILKKEKLRVLAALLGCEYNDLKQRQKEAQMRRALALTSVVMVLMSGFSIYAYQQNVKIQAEYTQKQISQARNIAAYSEDLLAQGDRDTAILLALEALPDGSDDKTKPMVTEAYNALSKSVYAYQTAGTGLYLFDKAITSLGTTYLQGYNRCQISPSGKYFVVFDESGIVQLYDTADGSLTQQISLEELNVQPLEDAYYAEYLQFADFVTDDEMVIITTHHIIGLKTGTTDVLWKTDFPDAISTDGYTQITDGAIEFSEDRGLLAAEYYNHIFVYDLQKHEFAFFGDNRNSTYDFDITFAPDKSSVLFCSNGSTYTDEGTEYKLRLVDLKKGTLKNLAYDAESALAAEYMDDGRLMILFSSKLSSQGISKRKHVAFSLVNYDLKAEEGKTIYEGEAGVQPEYRPQIISCQATLENNSNEERIIGFIGSQLFVLDKKGNVCAQIQADADITNIQHRDGNIILAGLENGTLARYNVTWDSDFPLYSICSPENYTMARFVYGSNTDTVILVPRDGNKFILCRKLYDDNYKIVDVSGDVKAEGYFFPEDSEDEIYRYITTSDSLKIWRLGDNEDLICDLPSVNGGNPTIQSYFRDPDGHMNICYSEEGKTNDDNNIFTFAVYDTEDKEEVWSNYIETRNCDLYCSTNCQYLVLVSYRDFAFIDKFTGEVKDIDLSNAFCGTETNEYIYDAGFSSDGKYIIFVTQQGYGATSSVNVYRYNIEENSWIQVPGLEDIDEYYERLVINDENNQMAYCKDGTSIDIYDIETLEIVNQIPVNSKSKCKYRFIGDHYMLYYSDDELLRTWDLEKNVMAMEDNQKYTGVINMHVQGDDYFSINAHQTRSQKLAMQAEFSNYVFWLNDDGTFSLYTEVPNSLFTIKGNEVFVKNPDKDHSVGVYPFYTLDQLIEKAKAIVGDKELSDADKVRYFIENN